MIEHVHVLSRSVRRTVVVIIQPFRNGRVDTLSTGHRWVLLLVATIGLASFRIILLLADALLVGRMSVRTMIPSSTGTSFDPSLTYMLWLVPGISVLILLPCTLPLLLERFSLLLLLLLLQLGLLLLLLLLLLLPLLLLSDIS